MCSIFFLGSVVLKSWGFSWVWCSLASVELQLLTFLLKQHLDCSLAVVSGRSQQGLLWESLTLCLRVPLSCLVPALLPRRPCGELRWDLRQLKTSGLKCCFAKAARPGSVCGWRSAGAWAEKGEGATGWRVVSPISCSRRFCHSKATTTKLEFQCGNGLLAFLQSCVINIINKIYLFFLCTYR